MLHPRVRHNDEEPGKPRTEKNQKSGAPVSPFSKLLLSKKEEPQERGFKEEGKCTLHRQRLTDDAPVNCGES